MLKKINISIGGKSLWLRFFIPYLLILIVPLIIGAIVYNQTYRVISNEVANSNLMMLNQGKAMLDRRLMEVESMVQKITMDSMVRNFQTIREPYAGPNPIRVLETRNSIAKYGDNNNFIQDFMILFRNNDLALTPTKSYSLDKMYDHYIRYEGMDYAQWRSLFLDQYHNRQYLPAQDVVINGERRDIMTYMQSLGLPSHYQGTVVVLIKNSEVQQMLKGLNISNGGWAYITDEHGTILASVTSEGGKVMPVNVNLPQQEGFESVLIDDNMMSVTYTTSAYNGWHYVAVQPSHVVMEKAYHIKRIMLTLLIVSLVVGLLFALYLSYRNFRPVRSLVNHLSDALSYEHGHNKDAYGFIERMFSELISKHEKLESEIEAQKPLLRANFFERLLKGGFVSRSQLEAQQRHIRVDLSGDYFAVAMLQMEKDDHINNENMLEELDVKRVVAKDAIRSVTDDHVYFYDAGENKFAVLFVLNAGSIEECAGMIGNVLTRTVSMLRQKFHSSFEITVGSVCDDLMGVSQSFEEANRSLNHNPVKASREIVWYEDIPKMSDHYHYPSDVETRLVNLVRAGNVQEVDGICQQLHKWNFEDRKLSGYMMELYVHNLLGSIIKLAEGTAIAKEEINRFVQAMHEDTEVGYEERFLKIRYKLLEICDLVEQQKKSHNDTLINNILAYLQRSFSDEMLNLSVVADRFNITEMYLSQFFKEQTGVNFSSYVEELRMSKARQLLVESKRSVGEIAGAVGYSSSNTFIRAFKRIHAMTPLAYRNNEEKRQEVFLAKDQSTMS